MSDRPKADENVRCWFDCQTSLTRARGGDERVRILVMAAVLIAATSTRYEAGGKQSLFTLVFLSAVFNVFFLLFDRTLIC